MSSTSFHEAVAGELVSLQVLRPFPPLDTYLELLFAHQQKAHSLVKWMGAPGSSYIHFAEFRLKDVSIPSLYIILKAWGEGREE